MLSQKLKAVGAAMALATTLVLSTTASVAAAAPAGNNGTLKVHEIGTQVGFIDNDPKVCAFNLEAFKLDAGQTGYLEFDVQGNDAPHGTAPTAIYTFGPANAEGYAISRDFNNGANTPTIPSGHYKVTLYGKMLPNGKLTDEKAKSKVFKVTCGAVQGDHDDHDDNCDNPKPTPKPEGGSGGGQVLGDDTTTPNVTPVATTSPQVLENTGSQTTTASMLSVLIAAAAVYISRKPLSESVEQKQARIESVAL